MQTRSCADLAAIAKQLQGTIYTRLGSMDLKYLNPQLRGALAMTGPGETVKPFFSLGNDLPLRWRRRRPHEVKSKNPFAGPLVAVSASAFYWPVGNGSMPTCHSSGTHLAQ
jgi:hypothetical protein